MGEEGKEAEGLGEAVKEEGDLGAEAMGAEDLAEGGLQKEGTLERENRLSMFSSKGLNTTTKNVSSIHISTGFSELSEHCALGGGDGGGGLGGGGDGGGGLGGGGEGGGGLGGGGPGENKQDLI